MLKLANPFSLADFGSVLANFEIANLMLTKGKLNQFERQHLSRSIILAMHSGLYLKLTCLKKTKK